MEEKIQKIIKIITGILAFVYFNLPVVIDITGWKIKEGSFHDFLFVASFPYNSLCNVFPNSHILRGMGQFIVFLIAWLLVYLLFRTINEMIFDIYLDNKRFRPDSDEESED